MGSPHGAESPTYGFVQSCDAGYAKDDHRRWNCERKAQFTPSPAEAAVALHRTETRHRVYCFAVCIISSSALHTVDKLGTGLEIPASTAFFLSSGTAKTFFGFKTISHATTPVKEVQGQLQLETQFRMNLKVYSHQESPESAFFGPDQRFGEVPFHIASFSGVPELDPPKKIYVCKDRSIIGQIHLGRDNAVKYGSKTTMELQRAAQAVVLIMFYHSPSIVCGKFRAA